MTIARRVAAGAAFLDEHDPQWWRADVERAIDLDVLDLKKTDRCVLGQRCPLEVLAARVQVDVQELISTDFVEAYDAYVRHLAGITGYDVVQWAHKHAFSAEDEKWEDLTAEWKRVITERRSGS